MAENKIYSTDPWEQAVIEKTAANLSPDVRRKYLRLVEKGHRPVNPKIYDWMDEEESQTQQ